MSIQRVLTRLNHVGVSVHDLDQAREFWIGGLGAEPHGEFGWPVGSAGADESLALADTAAEVVLMRTDAAFMELFRFTSPAQAGRPDDAPGPKALLWACADVALARERALAAGGQEGQSNDEVLCPDGTPVRLALAGDGPHGLVGVDLKVADADRFAFGFDGPVQVRVLSGAQSDACSPVDLGLNHVCLDVRDADVARAGAAQVRWHHPVTESSGGIARVCYGTTHDGVLVELLESRAPEAFFSRSRLRRADG